MARITVALISLFFIYNYIPKSELRSNDKVRDYLIQYFPQGWGYFTRNPQEEQYDFYKISNKSLVKIDFHNGKLLKNFLGISRSQRLINYEYTFLLSRCKKTIVWSYKTEINVDSILSKNAIIVVNYDKKLKYINNKDTVVAVLTKILPFHWELKQEKKSIPTVMCVLQLRND